MPTRAGMPMLSRTFTKGGRRTKLEQALCRLSIRSKAVTDNAVLNLSMYGTQQAPRSGNLLLWVCDEQRVKHTLASAREG